MVTPNKCKGRDCPDKEECIRYISKSDYYQWWDNYDLYREKESCTWQMKPTDKEKEAYKLTRSNI
jgi:hypothetical protein